ncbi:MAG TPA: ABC transporter permease, partial [Candidatus Saccharimonadia bacterium]|nr:ABC transporter permease [Candidatus Saccharimonadia bacterium]
MSVITRGVRNAFRNTIRTGSVIALLGIASALALAMLLANQAVKAKITDLKKSSATTLTVNAAGSFGGEGGGEPLTAADIDKVKKLANVSEVGAVMSSGGGMFRVSRNSESGTTQVQAPTSDVQL